MNNLYTEIETLLKDHIDEEVDKLSEILLNILGEGPYALKDINDIGKYLKISMKSKNKFREDISGNVYGRLTVLREVKTDRGWIVECSCSCGKLYKTFTYSVVSGNTSSCGCYRKELAKDKNAVHPMQNTKTWFVWTSMKRRCSDPSYNSYKNYGERGISYDPRWDSFEKFYEDMGECPKGLSLDRIDTFGNYCKENCRWADSTTQNFNQRTKKSNKSGRTGVWYSEPRNTYIAYISKNKVRYYIGEFSTFEEAVEVRELAEIDHYGYIKEY